MLPPPRGPLGPGCPLRGKHLTSGMQPRMDFWDTGREGPMVPPFTAVGKGSHSPCSSMAGTHPECIAPVRVS